MWDDKAVHVPLLPASMSWHCCPKTWEKVTGPAAGLGVTGGGESMVLLQSWVFVMEQSPELPHLPAPTDPQGQQETPREGWCCLLPGCQAAPFSLFKGEDQHTCLQLNTISVFIEKPKGLRLSQEVLVRPGQVERLQAQISTRH